MAQWVKPSLALGFPIKTFVQSRLLHFRSNTAADVPGEGAKDGSRTWAPATHRGDTGGVPGSLAVFGE